jgi:anti-sigma factor ChrR (cupin superfamily)
VSGSHDKSNTCALAVFFCLGTLDENEAWRFRQHLLDGCGSCTAELDATEEIVTMLGYATEPREPSPILRERIIDAIVEPPSPALRPTYAGEERLWKQHEIPGVSVRPLHVDERAREVVMLVRAEPGARYPGHGHAALEEMFMLEGELRFGATTYGPGDYIRSECGSIHGSSETPGGCMFLLRASLDNEVAY